MSRVVSRGREFWNLALSRQRGSGLSVAAFCRQESLSDKTFYMWRRRLQAAEPSESAMSSFAELVVDKKCAAGPKFEVTFDNGIRLTVTDITSNDQLVQILTALRASV